MSELVRVALVDTEPEAQLAVSLLEMEGIPAMWKASDMATTRLFGVGASGIMGPIAILVHPENAERAHELLTAPTEDFQVD